jgi:hypothetical protein
VWVKEPFVAVTRIWYSPGVAFGPAVIVNFVVMLVAPFGSSIEAGRLTNTLSLFGWADKNTLPENLVCAAIVKITVSFVPGFRVELMGFALMWKLEANLDKQNNALARFDWFYEKRESAGDIFTGLRVRSHHHRDYAGSLDTTSCASHLFCKLGVSSDFWSDGIFRGLWRNQFLERK